MDVLHLGNETLRQKAVPVAEVTDEIRELAKEMFITMDREEGVGLAAPQIGQSIRMFVLRADDGVDRVFINPQIVATSQETCSYEEGCLSVPKEYAEVIRPERITVQALNERGRRFNLEADGFLACVIQHENDHLDGILFIDRINPDKKAKIEAKFLKKAEKAEKTRTGEA
jgi:peptide deformylase